MTPADILTVALAPQFEKEPIPTPNHQIAADTMKPPMDKWQRPLSIDRVNTIAAYFTAMQELMPNPVLLSENARFGAGITVAPTSLPDESTGKTFDITIEQSGDKPLWILDGQHRIQGLAKSGQRDNPIPIVLLVNEPGKKVYDGGVLAKIFAQVTTAAKPLMPLHNDWLQFAFRIGPYESSRALVSSMEVVAKLASIPRFRDLHGDDFANAFYDKIQFNDYADVTGFQTDPFTCTQLRKLVHEFYYNENPPGELSPEQLASRLAGAFGALLATVPQPHTDSCFFGDKRHRREVMRDGFVIGCLSRLYQRPTDTVDSTFLKRLGFDTANWNFSWTKSFTAKFYTQSWKIARNIFRQIFTDGQLPANVPSVDQYFRGNGASFTIESSAPTKNGRRSRKGPFREARFSAGIGQALTLTNDTFLRVTNISKNVESIRVVDTAVPRAVPLEFPAMLKKGMPLESGAHSRPLHLTFVLTLFGGTDAQTTIDVNW